MTEPFEKDAPVRYKPEVAHSFARRSADFRGRFVRYATRDPRVCAVQWDHRKSEDELVPVRLIERDLP